MENIHNPEKQIRKEQGHFKDDIQNVQARSPMNSAAKAIMIMGIIAIVTVVMGLIAASILTTDQMYVIRPLLAACAIFIIFSYILKFRIHASLFGEIGFIYLSLALAYTILPAIKFLMVGFFFPIGFDWLNFAVLSPQPEELNTHLWRHVLFISSVAVGFLVVRSRPLPLRSFNKKSECRDLRIIIAILIIIVGCCICAMSLLSAPVTEYREIYTRFAHLSWPLRRFINLSVILKTGCYFVLLSLMFSQYRKYRKFIFIFVLIVVVYEIVYSFGSRIEAFTILLAFLGFYHFRVTPISLKKGFLLLIVLALVFSGIGFIRTFTGNLAGATAVIQETGIQASEFDAVYYTGFHLYSERTNKTLPPRDWSMFFDDFMKLIPFIDHTTYHPQYWYARNYYPYLDVPSTTMGVIADSAIWGGEFDLLVRSLINGAIFAFLTRWFFRRREKWWALTIYVYCYATCIMTLKYSVFYHVAPLFQIILPTLLLTGVLFRLQRGIFDTRPRNLLKMGCSVDG